MIHVLQLSDIVTRLESQVPGFESVDGAAELEKAIAGGVRKTPAGFVVPLDEAAASNSTGTLMVTQNVNTSFAVAYAVKNVSDRSGENAVDGGLRDLRLATLAALVGWAPGDGFNVCEFSGGSLIRIQAGTIFWRDKFRTNHINEN